MGQGLPKGGKPSSPKDISELLWPGQLYPNAMGLHIIVEYGGSSSELEEIVDEIGNSVVADYREKYRWNPQNEYRAYFQGSLHDKNIVVMVFPHLANRPEINGLLQSYFEERGIAASVLDNAKGVSVHEDPYFCVPHDTAMTSFVYEHVLIDRIDPTMGVNSQVRVTYDLCMELVNSYEPYMVPIESAAQFENFGDVLTLTSTSMPRLYIMLFLILCSENNRMGAEMSVEHKESVYGTLAHYAHICCEFDAVDAMYRTLFADTRDFDAYFVNEVTYMSLMEMESILKMYNEDGYNRQKAIYIASYIKHMALDDTLQPSEVAHLCASMLRLMYMTEYRESSSGNRLYCFKRSGWEICEGYGPLLTTLGNVSMALERFINDPVLETSNLSRPEFDAFKGRIHAYMYAKSNAQNVVTRMKTELVVEGCVKRRLDYDKTIVFNNGTFDFKLQCFRATYPHDLNAYRIRYDYYELGSNAAIEEELDDFMTTLFPCDETREYVYLIFSRCFEGSNVDKGIWFFIGNTNAGKSKFMDLVSMAFGEYSTRLHAKMFNDNSRQAGQATTALNQTLGRLVGVIQEPPKTNYNVEVIKEYTGESTLSARMLYQEGMQIQNSIRYFCCANATNISTSDAAFWRRLQVVLFEVQFLPEDEYHSKIAELEELYYREGYKPRFPTLEEELHLYAKENPNLSNVLRRIAPALMSRFIAYYISIEKRTKDIRSFSTVRAATLKFRLDNDPVFRFLKYCATIHAKPADWGTAVAKMTDVYRMFTTWYETSTHGRKTTVNMAELAGVLIGMGFQVYGEGTELTVYGLRLRTDTALIGTYSSVAPPNASGWGQSASSFWSTHSTEERLDEQKAALTLGLQMER